MNNDNKPMEFTWDGLPVQGLEARLELEQVLPDDNLFLYTPLKQKEYMERVELPVGA